MRWQHRWGSLVCGLWLLQGIAWIHGQEDAPIPSPRAARIESATSIHGQQRMDPYAWLRDRDNPKVLEYLKAENAYTSAMMKPAKGLEEKLFQEFKARLKEDDRSVPTQVDDYFYFTRTLPDQPYAVHYRKKGSLDAPEELLLDENVLAQGKPYFNLGGFAVSRDHQWLAYAVDSTGSEKYTVYFKNLATGRMLRDQLLNTTGDLEWANDHRTLFYTILDEAHRPYKLYRHVLGQGAMMDVQVYHEPDEMFTIAIGRSKDHRFLLMHLNSLTSSEVRYLPADLPTQPWQVLFPRAKGVEYSVDHAHGQFYILTTEGGAKNFKLMVVDSAQPSRDRCRELIPHRKEVHLEALDLFDQHLVILERQAGQRHIRILDAKTMAEQKLAFPEAVHAINLIGVPNMNSPTTRMVYSSPTTPAKVIDVNLHTLEQTLRKQREVLGGYDPSNYETERVWAKASDGVDIPMSLVYRKGMTKDGSRPLLLIGYGAYGVSSDPDFDSTIISLLDRGFIVATAHVRGGGELGRYWYEDGKLKKKMNTFTDFMACAEHLIREKYTSSSKLAISGGSAGGLLIGAVVNLKPELFHVAIAEVPFVDVINTMLDASLPLTAGEWDEWGDPRKKQDFDDILAYSPYDNVKRQAYPHMLVTAGLNDPRVSYWEPAKWVAKLREMKTNANWLLLKTNLDAGHGGASDRYEALREQAFNFAFLLHHMGIRE